MSKPSAIVRDRVIDQLFADIADRRGLKWEWGKIDDVVKQEIREAWRTIIEAALRPTAESGARELHKEADINEIRESVAEFRRRFKDQPPQPYQDHRNKLFLVGDARRAVKSALEKRPAPARPAPEQPPAVGEWLRELAKELREVAGDWHEEFHGRFRWPFENCPTVRCSRARRVLRAALEAQEPAAPSSYWRSYTRSDDPDEEARRTSYPPPPKVREMAGAPGIECVCEPLNGYVCVQHRGEDGLRDYILLQNASYGALQRTVEELRAELAEGKYCRDCKSVQMPQGQLILEITQKLTTAEAQVAALEGALTFPALRVVNAARCPRWHGEGDWSTTDWSNAFAGEAGEVCNAVKKLRRIEDGLPSKNEPGRELLTREAAIAKIGEEIADTSLYADLLANHLGIELAPHIIEKFNTVSEKYGFPERMDAALQPHPVQAGEKERG